MKTFKKNIFTTAIISVILLYGCEKGIQPPECNYIINIPDTAFKNELTNTWVPDGYMEGYIDYNEDGEICDGEAARITELYVSDSNIMDIEGIEQFVNLRHLYINGCSIESISFSSSSLLTLDCSENSLTNIDVSNMKSLIYLLCERNKLTDIDLSKNTKLKNLKCSDNLLTSIDLSNNLNLTWIKIGKNAINSLNVEHLTNLGILDISETQITTIDLSNNVNLGSLSIHGNSFSEIDLSNNINLYSLRFQGNPISVIDLSNNPNLTTIWFGNNPMTVLDISENLKVNRLGNEGEFPLEKICVWTIPFPPPGIDPYFGFQMINFPASFDGFEICD